MKKTVTILSAILLLLIASATPAQAQSLRDILGGIAGRSQSDGSSSSDGSGAIGDALGGLISGLLGSGKLTEADLAGEYIYKEPAVTFRSDNFLQKAGGAAMAATIVDKIEPYYERAGLNNLQVTLNTDKTFQFHLGKITLSGTFARDSSATESNSFIFNFKAFGKMSIGRIDADVQRTSGGIILTFDASKLLTLANTLAKLTGKQSLKAAGKFLESYDGLNLGFSLTRTSAAPAADSTSGATSTDATPADSTSSPGLGSLLDALRRR